MTTGAAVELVVFDVAGTTILDGDLVIEAMVKAFKHCDVPVDREAIRARMGIAKPVAIRDLLRLRADTISDVDEMVADVHDKFLTELTSDYRHAADVREADGASELFRHLHDRGIKIALDTGFSRAILDVLLSRFDWMSQRLVDISVTSDEVERGRPAPDLIHRAMLLSGASSPATVMKVGDTPADIASGHAAGCGCVVGVTYGTHSAHELERCRPTFVIDRLSQLSTLLDNE
jgi:phosphonatase-like hydrolase